MRASGAETLLDALCGPALLTDGHGAVLLANASALSALGEIGALLQGRHLRWHSAANQMAWSGGLAGLLAGAPSHAIALDASGAGWSVTMLRLRPLGVRPDGIGEQLTLALFEHVAAPLPRAAADGDAGEPLTPAETAILAGLLAGRSAKQLARERAVAVSTVRSQIATVLAKTRVHSQRELMARFAKR